MRVAVAILTMSLAGIAGSCAPLLGADATKPPMIVLPTRVNVRLQGQVAMILSEFKIATVVGVVGRIRPPTAAVRGAILRVLADQKLIASDTPGIGSVPSDSFRIEVMYTLQQFSVLNLPATVGAGATPPTAIATGDIVDGAVTGPKIGNGAVGTLTLADGSVTTPKLADNAVTTAKVGSQQASPGMSLVADGNGGAQWSYLTPLSGSIPDVALSSNVALLNAAQTFTNANVINPGSGNVTGLVVKQTSAGAPASDVFSVTNSTGATKYFSIDKAGNASVSGVLSGDGSGLANLNGSAIASGTVASARLPVATTASNGVVQPDGTSITIAGSVITANPAGINLNGDVTGAANANSITAGAVTGTKIAAGTITGGNLDPNISISTTGDVSTTGAGKVTSAGLLTASNGLTLSGGSLTLPNSSVADSALSANVALLNAAQTFSMTNTFDPGAADLSSVVVKQTSAVTPSLDVFSVTDTTGATKYLNVDKSGNTSASGSLAVAGSTTSTGLLTASNGLTLSGGSLTLPNNSVADSALSANVALLDAAQTFSKTNTFDPGVADLSSVVVKQTSAATPSLNVFSVTDTTGATKYLNVDKSGNTSVSGVLSGNGSGLTSLDAAALASGLVPVARLPLGTTAAPGALQADGTTITVAGGVISASAAGINLSGDVSGPANANTIGAGKVTGANLASGISISTTGNIATTGAGTITSAGLLKASNGLTVTGAVTLPNTSVADTALSGNVALLNAAQTFTNANVVNPGATNVTGLSVRQTSAGAPAQDVFSVTNSGGATKYFSVNNAGNLTFSGTATGNGSLLTALNATQLTNGTVPVARLPLATGAAVGAVRPDGVSITIAGGVISAVASGVILAGDVTGPGNANTIAAGAVTGAKIANATIAGTNLAANIAISTTGNIATTGAGTITSAGLLKASNGLTVTGALTLPNTSVADTALSVNVALKNGANVFTSTNTFNNTGLLVQNPAGTFTVNVRPAAETANRVLSVPLLGANDTVATLGTAQTFTGAKTFSALTTASGGLTVAGALTLPNTSVADTALSANVALKNGANTFTNANVFSNNATFTNTGLLVQNPAGTFTVNVRPAAETASRVLSVPLLGANDTIATLGTAQTFTGAKTFNALTTASGGLTVAGALTLPNTSVADTALSVNIPLKNGANVFLNTNTFTNTGLLVQNPAGTFTVNVRPAAETANRVLSVPLLGANDTLATLGTAQTFTGAKTFSNTGLLVQNPAGTFTVNVRPAAETANRVLSVPLLGANDTVATLGTAQTFTGAKTFSAGVTVNNAGLLVQNPAATFTVGLKPAAVTANRTVTLPDATGTALLASTLPIAVAGNTVATAAGVSEVDLTAGGVAATFTLTLNGMANGQMVAIKNSTGFAITSINGRAINVPTGQSQLIYVDNAGAVNRAAPALTFP